MRFAATRDAVCPTRVCLPFSRWAAAGAKFAAGWLAQRARETRHMDGGWRIYDRGHSSQAGERRDAYIAPRPSRADTRWLSLAVPSRRLCLRLCLCCLLVLPFHVLCFFLLLMGRSTARSPLYNCPARCCSCFSCCSCCYLPDPWLKPPARSPPALPHRRFSARPQTSSPSGPEVT